MLIRENQLPKKRGRPPGAKNKNPRQSQPVESDIAPTPTSAGAETTSVAPPPPNPSEAQGPYMPYGYAEAGSYGQYGDPDGMVPEEEASALGNTMLSGGYPAPEEDWTATAARYPFPIPPPYANQDVHPFPYTPIGQAYGSGQYTFQNGSSYGPPAPAIPYPMVPPPHQGTEQFPCSWTAYNPPPPVTLQRLETPSPVNDLPSSVMDSTGSDPTQPLFPDAGFNWFPGTQDGPSPPTGAAPQDDNAPSFAVDPRLQACNPSSTPAHPSPQDDNAAGAFDPRVLPDSVLMRLTFDSNLGDHSVTGTDPADYGMDVQADPGPQDDNAPRFAPAPDLNASSDQMGAPSDANMEGSALSGTVPPSNDPDAQDDNALPFAPAPDLNASSDQGGAPSDANMEGSALPGTVPPGNDPLAQVEMVDFNTFFQEQLSEVCAAPKEMNKDVAVVDMLGAWQ